MKKLLSIFTLLVILIIGVTAAFSYKLPEVKTYLTLNDIDQEIEQHITVNEQSINETLTSLYNKVNQLMTVGETYTEGTDITNQMEEFNKAYNESQTLQTQLTTLVDTDLKNQLSNPSDSISDEQKNLEIETIKSETDRINELSTLLKEIQSLNSTLEETEKIFYTKKPSEAIQYFNLVNNKFMNLEQAYKQYVDKSTNYFAMKENLFELLKK